MNKRAAMEVGINSIVILILGFVVLGIGLSFITGLMGQGRERLGGAMDINQLSVQPSSDNPVVTFPSRVNIKSRGTQELEIGVYNVLNKGADFSPGGASFDSYGIIECTGGVSFKVSAAPQYIEPGKSAGFKVFVVSEGADHGQYVCRLTFGEGSDYRVFDRDIYVSVVS